MKIITWNCNGALRNKFKAFNFYDADILVIQECENPLNSRDLNYSNWAKNYIWYGDNKNKGIGIFAKPDIKLEKLKWSNVYKNHEVKYFLPCKINDEFELVGVWNHKNNSPNFGYIGQLWKYLQINKNNMKNTILIGDFNSNSIWDQWDRWWNHSDVVKELFEIDIVSLYHKYFKEEQGNEKKATFFLHRNISKPYHIDYCFASKKIEQNLIDIEVCDFAAWKDLSDHVPLVFTINNKFTTQK